MVVALVRLGKTINPALAVTAALEPHLAFPVRLQPMPVAVAVAVQAYRVAQVVRAAVETVALRREVPVAQESQEPQIPVEVVAAVRGIPVLVVPAAPASSSSSTHWVLLRS